MSTAQTEASGGRREQLLAAAREVLAENGYERTTVSSIASRANVAQGTFYLYFPSKESLPGALALELSQALGEATARVTSEDHDLESAVSALQEAVQEAAEQFADVLPIANRGYELAEKFDEWLALTAPWRVQLEAFLAKLQNKGEIDADLNLETTAYVMRDLLDRTFKARVLFEEFGYADAIATLVRRALSPV
ncbi:MAG TPA: helix-turn-helix domain-containing protein [Solirubrobacteraceae bacterium]|jgi:AcrR family transcriptional regulator